MQSNNLICINCTFHDNNDSVSPLGGAAVFVGGGSLSCQGCLFWNNSVTTDGGALYLAGSSRVDLIDTVLDANHADRNGGAVYLEEGAHLQLARTTIMHNSAGVRQMMKVLCCVTYLFEACWWGNICL